MISRNIFNIKELKKIKIEKTVKIKRTNQSLNKGLFDVVYKSIDIGDQYHLGL